MAKALDLPATKVNYHLRLLEAHSLVREVEQRRQRGLTERVMAATARGYVLSSTALGDSAADNAPTGFPVAISRGRRPDGRGGCRV